MEQIMCKQDRFAGANSEKVAPITETRVSGVESSLRWYDKWDSHILNFLSMERNREKKMWMYQISIFSQLCYVSIQNFSLLF